MEVIDFFEGQRLRAGEGQAEGEGKGRRPARALASPENVR